MMRSIYNEPGIYIIRVAGLLDAGSSDRLGGLTVTPCEGTEDHVGPIAQLTGWLADQAALFGVLNKLYNDRYPVLYVEYVGPA